MNVLLLSVGTRNKIVRYFKNAIGDNGNVVATDMTVSIENNGEIIKTYTLAVHGDINGDGEVNVQIIDCAYGNNELLDQQNAKRTKLTAVIASNSNIWNL